MTANAHPAASFVEAAPVTADRWPGTLPASARPPFRVLHIHSGNLRGGIEGYLVSLVRYVALAPSMMTDVAVGFEGWLSRELRGAGGRVEMLGPVRIRHPASVLGARGRLSQLLTSQR